ncbi:MAG: hypothetical protein ACRC80_39610 [Waterburya sp.]
MAAKSQQNTELLGLKELISDRFNDLDRKMFKKFDVSDDIIKLN